ncbi:sensor histidine kinase [Nocardioides sp.]|uniref:sensor histidine kinase n=1 Tax=Nocardioides sp. TaxID=35761 RepID=UPI00261A10C5|nr:sensor histidine kinase [Nocardioides sp.]MCW2738580.1 phoR 2 [Nocardioides sp.]
MDARTRMPETDDLWRLTMDHSPVGMAIVSPAGDFLTANVALCDMLGYDPDEMAALSFQEITHPEDLAIDVRLVDRALAGEISSYRITKRYIRADGSTLIGDLSVALLRDSDGLPVHFISQIADLTERQAFVERLDAVEEALDSGQRQVNALFESVSVGLLLVEADGRYSASNRCQRELLDIAFPTGHLGRAGQTGFVYDAGQQHELASGEFPCTRATAGEEFDDVLIWIGEDPDTRRALSVSARAVKDRVGSLTGAVLAYHDVTERIRAVQVKDDFVATVSHELRTPLTAALAYLELMDDSIEPGTEVHQHVAAARRNMLRLSHLVADLLFSVRASSGSAVIDPYRVDAATVLREAIEAASVEAEGAGVALVSEGPPSLVVVADGMRLRQVVDNLLDNAIAYSSRGGRVTVTLAEDEGRLLLTVADDGDGIDTAEVGEVFSRFFRGASARRRQVPGTGLGLSIVRTVVEAHGGEVSVESTPGVGTTVRVELPR